MQTLPHPRSADPLARILAALIAEAGLYIGHAAEPARARREAGAIVDRIVSGRKPPAVMVNSRRDSVWVMNQHRHLDAPRVRLLVAIVLVVISIIGSALLVVADGIGGDVRWAHHSGASAAPLLLVAAAITAVSIAHPPKGRHALMRLVAILAFAAWGTAQLAPDPGVAGALDDVAILLFVLDAGCAVLSDARALRAAHRRRVPATWPAPGPPTSDRPVLLIRESAPAGAACGPAAAAPLDLYGVLVRHSGPRG